MKLFHESTLPLPARTLGERYVLSCLEGNAKRPGFGLASDLFLAAILLFFWWYTEFVLFAFMAGASLPTVRRFHDSALVRMIRRGANTNERQLSEQAAAPNGDPTDSVDDSKLTERPPSVS
jgi:hypothetical protein